MNAYEATDDSMKILEKEMKKKKLEKKEKKEKKVEKKS